MLTEDTHRHGVKKERRGAGTTYETGEMSAPRASAVPDVKVLEQQDHCQQREDEGHRADADPSPPFPSLFAPAADAADHLAKSGCRRRRGADVLARRGFRRWHLVARFGPRAEPGRSQKDESAAEAHEDTANVRKVVHTGDQS